MDKNSLSNLGTSNEPPDRGAPPLPSTDPADRATADGGPKPPTEQPASLGGAFQRNEPSRAERSRQR